MFFKNVIWFAILCCAVEKGLSKHLPSYITVCKRDQATIDKCAVNAVEKLRPKLVEGIPELHVPPIDPMYLSEIKPAPGDFATLNIVGKNVEVTGLRNFQIKSTTVDLSTLTVRNHIRIPKLHLKGHFSVDTQVLGMPFKGEGNFTSEAVKCDAHVVLYSKIQERDGKEYLKIKKIDTDINLKDFRIRLDGLFNGDPSLSEATNLAINQNKGEFLRAATPVIEKALSVMLLQLSNNIVKDVPLDELLPKH